MNIYLAAFIVISAIITYQDIHYCSDWPWPARFVFTALTFALLDLAAPFAPQLTAIMAGGMALGFGICTLRPSANCGRFMASCWGFVATDQPTELKKDPFLTGGEQGPFQVTGAPPGVTSPSPSFQIQQGPGQPQTTVPYSSQGNVVNPSAPPGATGIIPQVPGGRPNPYYNPVTGQIGPA